MNEMDTKIAAPILYDSNIYFQRADWGQKSNPYWRRLLFSENISKFVNVLCYNFNTDIENKACNYTGSTEMDKIEFHIKIIASFEKYRGIYVDKMKNFYTNWNAGLSKNDKERTFQFSLDRKKTVARADMEKMIDDGLTMGDFWDIDTLYVMIRRATCRHINHTRPLGIFPSKKDRCAVKTKQVDKKATEAKVRAWEKGGTKGAEPKPITKEVWACKRRMPQPSTDIAMIYNDPHKKNKFNLPRTVMTNSLLAAAPSPFY